MLKLLIAPQTRIGMTTKELQAYLRDVHGPLCLAQRDVGRYFRQYIHHYSLPAGADPLLAKPPLRRDAITSITFDDLAGFQASTSSEGYRTKVGPDEASFSVREDPLFFFVQPHTIARGRPIDGLKIFHFRKGRADADLAQVSAEWRGRLAQVLTLPGAVPLADYVHNVVVPAGPQPAPFDMIDEILIDEASDIAVAQRALREAEEGLFDQGVTVAMVTKPHIFIP